MRGFRRVNGVNWLNDVKIKVYYNADGIKELRTDGRLPAHWCWVRSIVLNKQY